jgi:small-conductance mechanosensitive channel
MRYLSLLFSLVVIGGLLAWYLQTNNNPVNGSPAASPAQAPQTIKQAQDSANALRQTLEQQQQKIDEIK